MRGRNPGLRLALSLAKVADVSWEKVEQQLWEDLGQAFTNIQQRAVIALAVFCLESGCRHEEKILDYFLLLALTMRPAASFADNKLQLSSAEIFSFNLTTLLNDIASRKPTTTERISLMRNIIRQLQGEPASFSVLVSVLLGLCRAIGRFSSPAEDFLISKIFPPAPALSKNKSESPNLLAFNRNFRYNTLLCSITS